MSRQEGRIHYGRQTTRSEGVAERRYGSSERVTEDGSSMPSWYNDPVETERKRTAPSNESVWAESRNARTRRAERQGTARDARRTLQQHENQSHRTPNRKTFYNTGGTQEDVDMFQAVAAGDHASRQASGRSLLDGVNSRGSWHSSNGSDYPALREHHRNDAMRIALPIAIVVVAIVVVALVVRSCTGA